MSKSNGEFSYSDSVSLKYYFESRLEDSDKALKLQNEIYVVQHTLLEKKIEELQKWIFMGLGGLSVIMFILRFFVR